MERGGYRKRPIVGVVGGQDFDSFSVWILIHRSEGGGYQGMANPGNTWRKKAAPIGELLFEANPLRSRRLSQPQGMS